MAFDQGDVVLVPFPFRDRLGEKARPGVIVSGAAYMARGDVVVAASTSQPPQFNSDYALVDWQAAGLKFPSTARMQLATLDQSRILLKVGSLSANDWSEVN